MKRFSEVKQYFQVGCGVFSTGKIHLIEIIPFSGSLFGITCNKGRCNRKFIVKPYYNFVHIFNRTVQI